MLYPMMMNLKGKSAVIIGGGAIAERKAAGLIEAGAAVTIISPQVTAGLCKLISEEKCTWKEKCFENKDAAGFFIIIAATDNLLVNREVKQAASDNQLVLMIDDPHLSDFQVPAMVRRGKLTLTVSTDGASPKLAKKIKKQLSQTYDERYVNYLEFLQQSRRFILENVRDPAWKSSLLEQIISDEFLHETDRKAAFQKLYESYLTGMGQSRTL
ncbi:NAD(P)-binding protein [Cytobacillus gottheilii]|uniref:NAD(P)-binding protein n=1 Tax=Cytobacillus gottheilii TaxID=859144 RepID=UPI00082F1B49|nr:NAD(P)-binding protein [Cytobacillus gottheilii]